MAAPRRGCGPAGERTAGGAGSSRGTRAPSEARDVPGDPEQPMGDPDSVARTICLRQLEHRARSRSELADVLRRRGVPDDAAVRVLDRFTEVGLIDDTALAQTMAAAVHRERGLARRAVAAKLRSRGLDDDTVGTALAQIDSESERCRAEELVARRARAMHSLAPEVRARRLVGLLARKGYASGMAYEVVRKVLGSVDGEPEGTDVAAG